MTTLEEYRKEKKKQTILISVISESDTCLTKSILEIIFMFCGVYNGVGYNRIWEVFFANIYDAISISSFTEYKNKIAKENIVDGIMQYIGIQLKGKSYWTESKKFAWNLSGALFDKSADIALNDDKWNHRFTCDMKIDTWNDSKIEMKCDQFSGFTMKGNIDNLFDAIFLIGTQKGYQETFTWQIKLLM